MRKLVILTGSASSLIDKYAKWQKDNPDVKDVEIHYSHAIAYPMDIHKSDYLPYESHAMLILFTEVAWVLEKCCQK